MKTMEMSGAMMMHHVMVADPMSDSSNIEKMTVADCCQQECKCPMSLSIAATLSSAFLVYNGDILSQKIEKRVNLLSNKLLTSLYRPPIF